MAETKDNPQPASKTMTSPTARPVSVATGAQADRTDKADKAEAGRVESERGDGLELPPLSELEEEAGDGPGSIRLDVDLATGEARKVKVDEKGKETR